jgi:hypothetical protein
MSESIKTTVYLNSADYRRLQTLAAQEGRSAAELVREAVAEYAERRGARQRPRSIGAFRSGQSDFAARAEEMLDGFGGSD